MGGASASRKAPASVLDVGAPRPPSHMGGFILNQNTMTNILPAINGLPIRQRDGLFSLNDLHRASGGEARHQPAKFTRREETQALAAEIAKSPDSANCLERRRGSEGGTYACRELVVAYAAWISPAFHLKVLRAFLGSAGGGGQNVPSSSQRTVGANNHLPLLPTPDAAAPDAPHAPFDWLDRHALEAARRSAQQWAQAVQRRPYSTASSPEDAISDEVLRGLIARALRGLIARALRGQRFIISLSIAPAGGWSITPLPHQAAMVDFEHDSADTIAEALPRRRVGELIAALAARLA